MGDGHAILEAEQIFEQHLHRIRQAADVAERRGGLFEAVISVGLAPDLERRAGVEAVLAGRNHGAALSEFVARRECGDWPRA